MKKLFIIVGIVVIAGATAWFFFFRNSDEPTVENAGPQDFPAQFDESAPAPVLTRFESTLGDLAFDYPNNWNVVESTANTKDEQLLTVESPLDANEFYFCLDLHMVSDGAEPGAPITDAEILATEQLEPGYQSVIYRVEGLGGLQWGLAEEAPETGATTFISEIASDSGNRLQAYGRFNCRETEKPDITVQEFQNSRWFHEAKSIVNTLAF